MIETDKIGVGAVVMNPVGHNNAVSVTGYAEGSSNGPDHGRLTGVMIFTGDGAGVRNHDLVRVTATTPIEVETADDCAFADGTHVIVYNVQGIPEANTWGTVTRTGPRSFTLDGTSGTGTYTGGGIVTNRAMANPLSVVFAPTVPRSGLNVGHPATYGDDCGGIAVYNGSPNGSIAADGIYMAHNPVFGDTPEVWGVLTSSMNAARFIYLVDCTVDIGIDLSGGTIKSGVALRLGHGQRIEYADTETYTTPIATTRTLKGGRADANNVRDVLATLIDDLAKGKYPTK